jgi:hypothetical protein
MNEEYAQAWDNWHKSIGDLHPSSYRRAHMMNECLKKLEAEERDLCQKIAKHVKMLMVSDLV